MPDLTPPLASTPDRLPRDPASRDWHEAFAALPLETTAADRWPTIAATLAAPWHRRRMNWRLPLAAAAAVVLFIASIWLPRSTTDSMAPEPARPIAQSIPQALPAIANDVSLEQLYAESARLEALLQYARDPRVASASAAIIAAELDARIAAIDAALMRPGLSPAREMQLWRDRVQALRTFTGFESTRRWLAAQGEHYDGALVRVD